MAEQSVRDLFLSHRSVNKDFADRLAADIEASAFQGGRLTTWVDEAEIRHGQSIPGVINLGLERSRFFGLVMTPAYFESDSGWTDAEWHAALHVDPDNRRGRILPLLAADCPYIPMLLRHLRAIDFRDDRYTEGLDDLLRILRDEPLPRPIPYRGQLLTAGRIDRSTLVAERAVVEAHPDVHSENLYCNLVPVERLPQYLYVAPIAARLRRSRTNGPDSLPTKQEIKGAITAAQTEKGSMLSMPAFRVSGERIFTFHDLEDPEGPLASVIDPDEVDVLDVMGFVPDEDNRRILVSLLNMALYRRCRRVGLVADDSKPGRFFFPSKDGGPHVVTWRPLKRTAIRTVAKPCQRDGRTVFWRHLGAYLRIVFLANRFYLQVTPTWVITDDSFVVRGGPQVGRLVSRWTGPERNLHLLYHVRFWTMTLRGERRGPISIRTGDQTTEISTASAFIQLAYGIARDQKDLMRFLDEAAPTIGQEEDKLADMAVEFSMETEAAAPSELEEAEVPSVETDERTDREGDGRE
jgi:TIR domain-containing protein